MFFVHRFTQIYTDFCIFVTSVNAALAALCVFVSLCSKSLYIKHSPLEIFTLGMENVDGMVGRLVELMKDAHIAMGKGCGGEDGIAEIILGDHLRTRKREENATGSYFLESLHVKASVTLEGIVKRTAVLGKSGRVEDDKVIVATCTVEILEGILAESLVTVIAGEVELDVLCG